MRSLSREEFLTVAEVAGRLKLNEQTVRNWIDAGTLPALRIGRRVRILRSDFDRFVEGSYTGAAQDDGTGARGFWEGAEEPAGDFDEP
jgi:excisionase family DNA binding protein